MTAEAPAVPSPARPRAEAWTYASGRAAAVEGRLLGREALERLAEATSPAEASAALADSPLRAVLSDASTPAETAAALDEHYSGVLADLEADCPLPDLFELASLRARFGALKERVREGLAAGSGVGTSPESRAALLGDFEEDSEAARGLELLSGVLAAEDAPEPEPALDLVFDSARLLEELRLAAELGDADVLEHVRQEVAVRAVLLLWRSRLVSAQDDRADGTDLVARLFLRGKLAELPAARLWARPLASWGRLIAEEFGTELGEAFGSGSEDRLAGWDKAAFDRLTRRAGQLRGQAFGVGRVYAFVRQLAIEEHNVRLAAVGRLRGVAPGVVRELFREAVS